MVLHPVMWIHPDFRRYPEDPGSIGGILPV